MRKNAAVGCFAAFGIFLLILDAQTALSGANEAIELCIRVLIPSLFPFFFLINLLNSTIVGRKIRILYPLERLLCIPKGCGGVFIAGILGGYPTGAQLVFQSWKSKQLTLQDANRMLCFCNNAGPAFLFGIIARYFQRQDIVWIIWTIHIISAFVVSFIHPRNSSALHSITPAKSMTVTEALRIATKVMASVCGWVILFRIVISFARKWFIWLLPTEFQVAVISVFELANGCSFLHLIKNDGLRMIICSTSLSFGGLCVAMQTASVTNGLNLCSYLRGKILQGFISLYLTAISQQFLFADSTNIKISSVFLIFIPMLIISYTCLMKKFKITVAFRKHLMYNQITKS